MEDTFQTNLENDALNFVMSHVGERLTKILMNHRTMARWVVARVEDCKDGVAGRWNDPLGVRKLSMRISTGALSMIPIDEDERVPDGEYRFVTTAINFYDPKNPTHTLYDGPSR